MAERLLSVGVDVGTTSTQLVVSELEIENQAGSFSVPQMQITRRKIRYKSPVHFTPLLEGELVDAGKLRQILDEEYAQAGITKASVDTGAVIITGETSRKENAGAVLAALSDYAGDFVVATAGPDLESRLAAKGAGAAELSEKTGKPVLHMDIGGGTTNLAFLENGTIRATGCLNVGGRLLKINPGGKITYKSPVLKGIFRKEPGDAVSREEVLELARQLVQALEMAAGLRTEGGLLGRLQTPEAGKFQAPAGVIISFSGGVADCVERRAGWLEYGDMGPELGQAIRESLLCREAYVLGSETIRATVIGAGCHSAQLSGSTVFFRNVQFPMKNLPVVAVDWSQTPEKIREKVREQDGNTVLAVTGITDAGYEAVAQLAEKLVRCNGEPLVVALEADIAKALGQQLALRKKAEAEILCIDRVKLQDGDYLDVGPPVGPALPIVVKTLILNR